MYRLTKILLSLQASKMQLEQRIIELSNGQQINYVEFNPEGKVTVIFVHGNLSSWVWWTDVLQLLKENTNYHVIAIDQRGFGKSSYKQPVTRFTQHAEDLKDFIQLKGLKDVILVGWSYGGGISMKTAQIAPQLVSKIIPTASISHLSLPFINQKGQNLTTRQQILTLPRFAMMQNVIKSKNFQTQKGIFDAVLFPKMPNYPEEKKKQLIECSFAQAEYMDVLVALANSDINIQNIKTKALMLHGQEDVVIKLDSVIETGNSLGNCLEIWQNHAHMLPIQDPKRFVERISKFIDQK